MLPITVPRLICAISQASRTALTDAAKTKRSGGPARRATAGISSARQRLRGDSRKTQDRSQVCGQFVLSRENAAWYTIWQWMPISVLPQADPGNLPGRRPLAPLHLLYFLRGRILGVAASPYSHAYMGLDTKAMQFLLTARGSGVSFERIATIGRQRLCVTPAWLRARLHAAGIDRDTAATARLFKEADGYAEPLLRVLGAARIISLDASSYEGASRVADLNAEIAPDLENAFTTVLDSGSIEHVFDFRAAIANCMRMVAPGGHLLIVTPANNMAGHGFYQFSPELFYRVLSESNGFLIERMLVTELSSLRWYDVADPAVLGTRVQFRTYRPDIPVRHCSPRSTAARACSPTPTERLRVEEGEGRARGCAIWTCTRSKGTSRTARLRS